MVHDRLIRYFHSVNERSEEDTTYYPFQERVAAELL